MNDASALSELSQLSQLSPAVLAALRSRHIAWLATRLTDERAERDFTLSFVAYHEHLLGQPIRDLFDPKALVAGLGAILTSDAVRGFFAPIVRDVHARALASLRSDDAKLGDYVPKDARTAIDALLAKPDLVPEPVVRRIFEDDATEDVMRDVLYDALVEFNESVNPFFAEWGLPGLLKRFMPIGSGAVIKSLGAVRAEFDKRLEPEIRKFLLVFSRKSKSRVAGFVLSKADDPKFVALRRNVVAALYEQTLAEILHGTDDASRANVDTAGEHIVLEVLQKDRPRERLLAALEDFIKEHGDATLGEWLTSIGVTAQPELEQVAALLWPHVKRILESPPARAFYERITWDFYASLTPA